MAIEKLLLDIDESRKIEPKGIFCWEYSNSIKSIRCFGAHHEFGWGEQALEIVSKFKEYQPDCVFVEAYKNKIKTGQSLEDLKQPINESFKGNESQLLINLALRGNIKIFSCEPSHTEEIQEMAKTYKPEELLAFYILRSMHFYEHEKKSGKDVSVEIYFDQLYKRYEAEVKEVFPDFYSNKDEIFLIYQEWFGRNLFNLSQKELYMYIWPVPHDLEWQKSNEISRSSGNIRDEFILKNIETLQLEYKKIFCAYGKSHIPRWDKALCRLYSVDKHRIIMERVSEVESSSN